MTQRRNQSELCQSLDRSLLHLIELHDGPGIAARAVNATDITPWRVPPGRVHGRGGPVAGLLRCRRGGTARGLSGRSAGEWHDGGVAAVPTRRSPQQDRHDAVVAALTADGAGVAVDEHGGSPSLSSDAADVRSRH